jgi:hypothetical protein
LLVCRGGGARPWGTSQGPILAIAERHGGCGQPSGASACPGRRPR